MSGCRQRTGTTCPVWCFCVVRSVAARPLRARRSLCFPPARPVFRVCSLALPLSARRLRAARVVFLPHNPMVINHGLCTFGMRAVIALLTAVATRAPTGGIYKGTAATWRSLPHLGHFLQPPLPSLEQLLQRLDSDQRAALELGCGEGRALLELQSRFPRAKCHCLSSKMWDCMRRDSSRSHHEFACATSNMTGKSMEWLRQVATNYGIPMESQLPMINFGDFGKRMPFADQSLDFIYSQHALNKLPSPRTHFAPFMSEIARLLRPNGTALLQLIPCCLSRTRTLKYGAKVVYSGSDSYTFEIIDDRFGCEAAGLERVTIFRAPEADPESEAQGPYAFVLLAHKGTALAQCATEVSPSPAPAQRKLWRRDKHSSYLQEFLDAVHTWLRRAPETSKQLLAQHSVPSPPVRHPDMTDSVTEELRNGSVVLPTGLRMPRLGFGTGGQSVKSLQSALRHGYRLIDTAVAYRNEQPLALALTESGVSRRDLFIVSKAWPYSLQTSRARGVGTPGVSPAQLRRATLAHIRRLNVGYLDVLLLHWPSAELVRHWEVLTELKREGKARAIGICNVGPDVLQQLVQMDEPPVIVQTDLAPVQADRRLEADVESLIKYCSEHGIQLMSHSPIKGALHDARAMRLSRAVRADVPQLVLRYVLQRGFVAIFGSSSVEHIRSNLRVFDFQLTRSQMAEIACWRNPVGCDNLLHGAVGWQLQDEARRHLQLKSAAEAEWSSETPQGVVFLRPGELDPVINRPLLKVASISATEAMKELRAAVQLNVMAPGMPRIGKIDDLRVPSPQGSCLPSRRFCDFRLEVTGAATPNKNHFDARYRALALNISSKAAVAFGDPQQTVRKMDRAGGAMAQHVLSLRAWWQSDLATDIRAVVKDYLVPFLSEKVYGHTPRLKTALVSRNVNDFNETYRKLAMLWHWDSLPEDLVKVILYLNDVSQNNGCMSVMRHNHTGEVVKLHPSHPWGRKVVSNVPKLWLSELIGSGYRPECLHGPSGTLVAFDTNIVHRGSRPAPSLYRDFVLFEFTAGKPTRRIAQASKQKARMLVDESKQLKSNALLLPPAHPVPRQQMRSSRRLRTPWMAPHGIVASQQATAAQLSLHAKMNPLAANRRRAQASIRSIDSYLLTLYGNSSERSRINNRVSAALGLWHVKPKGSLAKRIRQGASNFAKRLIECARIRDAVLTAWLNATSMLLACRAAPAACSLCQFQDKGDRFFVAVHAAASMRFSTWAVPMILWALAALSGGLVALLSRVRHDIRRRPAASAHWRRTPLNLFAVFWSQGQGFAHPIATLKLTILLLLTIDLLGIGAPELNIIAVPELIARVRSHPVLPEELLSGVVLNLTGIFMPGLSDSTADLYVARLVSVRYVLFGSWALFLVLPVIRLPKIAVGCYLLGAATYITLGSLALMYNLAHSTQSSILFVAASTLAAPGLVNDRRAAIWLRQFLFLCVIAPVYLFSGISKIRYIGLHRQLTGAWMVEDKVLGSTSMYLRASLPSLNELVLHAPSGLMLMSLGNLAVEVVAPIGVLLSAPFSTAESIFRAALCLLALTFHSLVFLQMGPNFVRHCMLLLIALDPLAAAAHKDGRPAATYMPVLAPPTAADRFRGATASAVLLGWFYVQIHSDASHLLGHTAPEKKIDSYWPISEMSMFAKPSADTSFRMTGGLATILLAVLLFRVSSAGKWLRQQHEAAAAGD